jgi:ATP-dependent Lon protease
MQQSLLRWRRSTIKVTEEDVLKVLGVPRLERDKYESNDVAGVVTGLAWTSVGGDILLLNRFRQERRNDNLRKLRYGDERSATTL